MNKQNFRNNFGEIKGQAKNRVIYEVYELVTNEKSSCFFGTIKYRRADKILYFKYS